QAVATEIALPHDAAIVVEPRHLVGTGERAVRATDALVVEVDHDPGDGILLVRVHRAAAQARGIDAVVARRGHGLLPRRRAAADEDAHRAEALVLVGPVERVACRPARLAARARVEVDLEPVLLTRTGWLGRQQVAVVASLPGDDLCRVALREALDSGELVLGP